jgi:hypothetical protein
MFIHTDFRRKSGNFSLYNGLFAAGFFIGIFGTGYADVLGAGSASQITLLPRRHCMRVVTRAT